MIKIEPNLDNISYFKNLLFKITFMDFRISFVRAGNKIYICHTAMILGRVRRIRKYLFHPYLGSRMFNFQELEDGCSVVSDGHISDVVHQHLVQAHGSEGGLDDVGDGLSSHHVLRADVASGATLALNTQHVCNCRHLG